MMTAPFPMEQVTTRRDRRRARRRRALKIAARTALVCVAAAAVWRVVRWGV